MVGVASKTMAKKMGRPKTSQRQDVTIKFDKVLAAKARQIAITKNITMVEYLCELARPIIDKDYAKVLRSIEEGEAK